MSNQAFKGLLRYGIKWNGPTEPIAVPMDDGYWTPWHIAVGFVGSCDDCGKEAGIRICTGCWEAGKARACSKIEAELEALRVAGKRLLDCYEFGELDPEVVGEEFRALLGFGAEDVRKTNL